MNEITDHSIDSKVIIDDECIKIMEDSNRSSVSNYPSDNYIKTAKFLLGRIGIVTRKFRPGFEVNVTWNIPYKLDDGRIQNETILQVKDNWVKSIKEGYYSINGKQFYYQRFSRKWNRWDEETAWKEDIDIE